MKPSTTPTSWHNRMHISREPTGYTGNTSISDRHVVVFLLPDIYIPSRKTCMLLSSCHILFYFVLIHSVSLLLFILYSFFLRSAFIPMLHHHQFRFLRKKREGGGNNGGSYDDITSSEGGKQEKKLSLLTLVSFTFYMRNTRERKTRTNAFGRQECPERRIHACFSYHFAGAEYWVLYEIGAFYRLLLQTRFFPFPLFDTKRRKLAC